MDCKVDVFLCTAAAPDDEIREGFLTSVHTRWDMDVSSVVRLVTIELLECSLRDFQGERRRYAERNAQSDIYVLAEDDCMPLGNRFIERGLELMQRNPAYAVISPTVLNGVYEGAAYTPDGELILANSAGGINFTRKGLLGDLPAGFVDEMKQSQHLCNKGWLSGYAPALKMNHLGAGLSTLWPDAYTGRTQIADL